MVYTLSHVLKWDMEHGTHGREDKELQSAVKYLPIKMYQWSAIAYYATCFGEPCLRACFARCSVVGFGYLSESRPGREAKKAPVEYVVGGMGRKHLS